MGFLLLSYNSVLGSPLFDCIRTDVWLWVLSDGTRSVDSSGEGSRREDMFHSTDPVTSRGGISDVGESLGWDTWLLGTQETGLPVLEGPLPRTRLHDHSQGWTRGPRRTPPPYPGPVLLCPRLVLDSPSPDTNIRTSQTGEQSPPGHLPGTD